MSEVDQFEIHADQFVSGWQPVGEAYKGLVGTVGDFVAGLGYGQENLFAAVVGLEVGGDFDTVVVRDYQFEFELFSFAEGGDFFCGAEVVADVIYEFDYIRTADFENPFSAYAAADLRDDLRMQLFVDHHLIDEEGGPGLG